MGLVWAGLRPRKKETREKEGRREGKEKKKGSAIGVRPRDRETGERGRKREGKENKKEIRIGYGD